MELNDHFPAVKELYDVVIPLDELQGGAFSKEAFMDGEEIARQDFACSIDAKSGSIITAGYRHGGALGSIGKAATSMMALVAVMPVEYR